MIKLDRNNTDFIVRFFETIKNIKWDKRYDFLRYYQNIVRYFIKNIDINTRGLLVKHGLGTGKSILAVAIAIDLIDTYQPILLMAKSLQENMRNSIHKYIELRKEYDKDFLKDLESRKDIDKWIDKKFLFISMNASNMLKQLAKKTSDDELGAVEKSIGVVNEKIATLNGKLLIVDEAHNLFRGITNGSKNSQGLYDLVTKANNVKVIFLTGTPINNDPFELVPCFNMLVRDILPETYREFNKLYVSNDKSSIINKEKFQNRLMGLVSYVTHESTPGKFFKLQKTSIEFPKELDLEIVKVHMEPDQYTAYLLARDKEKEEGSGKFIVKETPALTKPKGKSASSYRVNSRQISNYYAPPNKESIPKDLIDSPKFRALYKNIEKHEGLGLVYSQFVGSGGIESFTKYLEKNNWNKLILNNEKYGSYDSVDDYLNYLYNEVEKSEYYNVYYNDNNNTLNDLNDGFKYTINNAIKHSIAERPMDDTRAAEIPLNDNKSSKGKTFAIISGNIPVETRTEIQNMFNDARNINGGIIDLLIISSTGAEGLDLKNVRHIHIMEPYWNYARIKQIIARGVRANSHINLPKEKRNVQPYIYLAIPPKEEIKNDDYSLENLSTTDTELYNEALKNYKLINEFNQALHEISIECMINEESYCRLCTPTNQKLYSNDPLKDIKANDPCKKLEEKKIKVKKITHNDKIYYYNEDPESIYDYAIYIYDDKINSYKRIDESEPIIEEIIEKIKSNI